MLISTLYKKLEQNIEQIKKLDFISSILSWDSAVMMPSGSQETRSDLLCEIELLRHKKFVSQTTKDLLSEIRNVISSDDCNLTQQQQRNFELIEHEYNHISCLPIELVEEFKISTYNCEYKWREARAENDFHNYKKSQQKVIELSREIAKFKAKKFNTTPYNALLDQYDPGRKDSEIQQIFHKLKKELPHLIEEIKIKQSKNSLYEGTQLPAISTEKQKQLSLKITKILGFDFQNGRLDVSHHPFTGGIPTDVRMTTRYDESNFITGLMGIIHECGHAIYEQNLPKALKYQPIGSSQGMSIHESQSLLFEMQIARSKIFIEFLLPHIDSIFNLNKNELSLEQLLAQINYVNPSLVRVDADECTYPLHIIIRYELEKLIIEEGLNIDDLPGEWNKRYKEYLGIDVTDYKNGCMQDIHWTDGSFGYFPCYTLGAMHAAEIFHIMKQELNNLENDIKSGEFHNITKWLKDNLHQYANTITGAQLLEKITQSKQINVDIFLNHLKNRYL